MHRILYRHIMKMEARVLFLITLLCASVVYVFTFAECLKGTAPPASCAWVALLQTPYMCFVLFPYFFFASVLATIWLLANSNQIIIMKTSKMSTIRILTPFMTVAALSAGIWLLALQPIGIWTNNKATEIENKILKRTTHKTHVWLTHQDMLIYANELKGNTFCDMYAIDNDNMCYSPVVSIQDNHLVLQSYNDDDILCEREKIDFPNAHKYIDIHTRLVQHVMIHDLYIAAKKNFGPSYKKQLHILLSSALCFFTFTIISAIIALSINRFSTKLAVGIQAACCGIVIQFSNEIIRSLLSGNEPWMLYCLWLPNIIYVLIAIGYLIWKEE